MLADEPRNERVAPHPRNNNPPSKKKDAMKNIPPKLNVPPAQEHHDNTDKTKRNGFKWWNSIVGTATLFAVIYYACIASNTLNALLESNRINKSAFDRAYRPYIGVNAILTSYGYQDSSGVTQRSEAHTPKSTFLDFKAQIKNFGLVPGTNSSGSWRVFVGDTELGVTTLPNKPSTTFPNELLWLTGEIGGQYCSAPF
ncbi:MAG: hypothetical protein ACRD50_16120 [Candidatus Acidiferrales bacterium]